MADRRIPSLNTPVRAAVQILRVAGIPIRIHFTFFLLLGILALTHNAEEGPVAGMLLFVLAVFACVALHELGHALMARRFGIRTTDITLYPIGGIARLKSMGTPPQELWIALAGPAVNLLIALAIGAGLFWSGRWIPLEAYQMDKGRFLQDLMLVNVALMLFNLLPAFPMDGGRVLRSILARFMPKARATGIAAFIGRVLAVGMAVAGIHFGNYILVLIAAVIWFAGRQESVIQSALAALEGRRAGDAMEDRFLILSHGERLGEAAMRFMSTPQPEFPVFAGGSLIGTINQEQLEQGLRQDGPDGYVAGSAERQMKIIDREAPLYRAFDWLMKNPQRTIWVSEGERLVGYIRLNLLMELLERQQRLIRRTGFSGSA